MLRLEKNFTGEHEGADLRPALSPGQPGGSPVTAVQAGKGGCTAAVHHILEGEEPDQGSTGAFCLPLLIAACSVHSLLAVARCAARSFLLCGCSIHMHVAVTSADGTKHACYNWRLRLP